MFLTETQKEKKIKKMKKSKGKDVKKENKTWLNEE
jgi:hypothetical protein